MKERMYSKDKSKRLNEHIKSFAETRKQESD